MSSTDTCIGMVLFFILSLKLFYKISMNAVKLTTAVVAFVRILLEVTNVHVRLVLPFLGIRVLMSTNV